MKVIKRDGTLTEFDKTKIENAILKAMKSSESVRPKIASDIADEIYEENKDAESLTVYEIEQFVFNKLIAKKHKLTARTYEGYRSVREFQRNHRNTIDNEIKELLDGTSEYWKGENSNKDSKLNTTQRDYLAGIVSKDASRGYILPPDIIQAHDDGLIHIHDMDYLIQFMHNCDLVNLDDMLQNSTVISETLIEKPHSFSTACTIMTQIIAQVASAQYGGQSESLEHLAPFVDVSRRAIRKEVQEELSGMNVTDDFIEDIVKKRLAKEIAKGIQTIQYQITTLMTTNGQAPFITLFIYLNEARDEQTKADLVLLTEEVFKQTLQGVKNVVGEYVTPAFPKIIYVLEEDNCKEGTKYWWLTQKAAECSNKRLSPDYISEKVMKEMKEDNCFPVMG